MPKYVVLLNWTEQGVKSARDTVDRSESARSQWQEMGVGLIGVYWTVGPYDNVVVVDAPDDETLSAAVLALAGLGNVRTTTMRAFDSDEMRRVIEKLP